MNVQNCIAVEIFFIQFIVHLINGDKDWVLKIEVKQEKLLIYQSKKHLLLIFEKVLMFDRHSYIFRIYL